MTIIFHSSQALLGYESALTISSHFNWNTVHTSSFLFSCRKGYRLQEKSNFSMCTWNLFSIFYESKTGPGQLTMQEKDILLQA